MGVLGLGIRDARFDPTLQPVADTGKKPSSRPYTWHPDRKT
jgi:hypothetical protein